MISFAGELLSNAEGLLRDGLHTSEVADGYTKAADKASAHTLQRIRAHPHRPSSMLAVRHHAFSNIADRHMLLCWTQALAVIDSLVLPGTETLDVRDKEAVAKRIKGAVSAKQHGLEDVLCPLIAEVSSPACTVSITHLQNACRGGRHCRQR